MNFIELIHEKLVRERRIQNLGEKIAFLLPKNISVLDLGGGDGAIAKYVKNHRPDISITCIDVNVYEHEKMPIEYFDGETIPYSSSSFDCVMLIDVLHHTIDPYKILSEAERVSQNYILVKDQKCDGLASIPTLKFMDTIGNKRHGVSLPFNYWKNIEWKNKFNELNLNEEISIPRLKLYPWWADWWFGARLNFIALLKKDSSINYNNL